MQEEGIEKRTCIRFQIPGATVRYQFKEHVEEFSPLVDISRGGLKFIGKKPPEMNAEVTLNISIPGERIPFTMHGKVRWLSYVEDKDQYFIGLQFNPYGEKDKENYPGNMVKIIALEQKYAVKERVKTEKFEID
ncbi:MAG: PilZ domain-containing protein [Candidatus Aminicenantes bacterium]|nr:PilZ domain-containing protein [Candidatus Aminicenantes bacterium]